MLTRYLALLALPLAAPLVQADPHYPQWWFVQSVVGENPPPGPSEVDFDPATWDFWVDANQPPATTDPGYEAWMIENYTVANIGQLKHMARAAYLEMEAGEAGSAGDEIENLVLAFSTDPSINLGALNLGQVKAVAAPFYDRMHADGFTVVLSDGTVIASGAYPWDPLTPVAENYKLAILGQLKHVFSFDLSGWPPNQPPAVNAGDDIDVLFPPGEIMLSGVASDADNGPQLLTVSWDKVSGPGTVSFSDSQILNPQVTFSAVGEYVLRLTANDGDAQATDEITIDVVTDADGNGISDVIDSAWADMWTNDPDLISITDSDFYDPRGIISDTDDFLPVKPLGGDSLNSVYWDYDGDGISNFEDVFPDDYFNGDVPVLSIFRGNNQVGQPLSFLLQPLQVSVVDAGGVAYVNAPVKFEVQGGYEGLSYILDSSDLNSQLVGKTNVSGASVRFFTPTVPNGTTNVSSIVVSLPSNISPITFTATSVTDFAPPPYDFKAVDNDDGTTTYSWRKDVANPSGNFRIRKRDSNGDFVVFKSLDYATLTRIWGRFTVTLDASGNIVP